MPLNYAESALNLCERESKHESLISALVGGELSAISALNGFWVELCEVSSENWVGTENVINSELIEDFSCLFPDEITTSFRRYGPLIVDWPHKAESKSYFPPKGYAFLLFQVSVDDLIAISAIKSLLRGNLPHIYAIPRQFHFWLLAPVATTVWREIN